MAHEYPSKSKIRSYFIKPFMMKKTTFHTGTKGRARGCNPEDDPYFKVMDCGDKEVSGDAEVDIRSVRVAQQQLGVVSALILPY